MLGPAGQPSRPLLEVLIALNIHRRTGETKVIGDDGFRPALTLQRLLHVGQRRCLVANLGDNALQNLAFVVDGNPR